MGCHINDLPKAVECTALPILFADDTSILLTSPNNIQMQNNLNFRIYIKGFTSPIRI